jgi:hypothetical protein
MNLAFFLLILSLIDGHLQVLCQTEMLTSVGSVALPHKVK